MAADPSGFAMQVTAGKDAAIETALLLCRSLLGSAGEFAVRERCNGKREDQ